MIDEYTGKTLVSPLDLPMAEEIAGIKKDLQAISETLAAMEELWPQVKAELLALGKNTGEN